jgi:uncharacterized surface protein with fasciclin (FAS1) repeats
MYKTFTKFKTTTISLVAASTLFAASAVVAGPGKPGQNDLAPGGNIVEVAIAANGALGVFNTVLTAATCDYFEGAVVAVLAGSDKVTLFAPTDGAFAELGLDASNVCSAFEATPEALLGILAYHVTEGRRFSNSVFNRNGNAKDIEMLLGTGSVMTEGGMIYDAGSGDAAGIVGDFYDINASNGVIHVIDKVLLP